MTFRLSMTSPAPRWRTRTMIGVVPAGALGRAENLTPNKYSLFEFGHIFSGGAEVLPENSIPLVCLG